MTVILRGPIGIDVVAVTGHTLSVVILTERWVFVPWLEKYPSIWVTSMRWPMALKSQGEWE
jgi:hypothetical protein